MWIYIDVEGLVQRFLFTECMFKTQPANNFIFSVYPASLIKVQRSDFILNNFIVLVTLPNFFVLMAPHLQLNGHEENYTLCYLQGETNSRFHVPVN